MECDFWCDCAVDALIYLTRFCYRTHVDKRDHFAEVFHLGYELVSLTLQYNYHFNLQTFQLVNFNQLFEF